MDAEGVKSIIDETRPRMAKVQEDFRHRLAGVRTGRASVSLLDNILVSYYGTPTPLPQMASVSAPEPQLITVQPWDKSQIGAIEKAISAANLGLNPANDGNLIRLPVPPLNEERRKLLVRQVSEFAEEHRTALRNVRRDANEKLKKMLKDKKISEDNERDGLDEIQKITTQYVSRIDDLAKQKEHELMTV